MSAAYYSCNKLLLDFQALYISFFYLCQQDFLYLYEYYQAIVDLHCLHFILQLFHLMLSQSQQLRLINFLNIILQPFLYYTPYYFY